MSNRELQVLNTYRWEDSIVTVEAASLAATEKAPYSKHMLQHIRVLSLATKFVMQYYFEYSIVLTRRRRSTAFW